MPQENELPYFENPPIVEALLGVQFAPLKGWSIPHFGLFWDQIRPEYPKCAVQAPLAPFLEGKKRTKSVIELIPADAPSVRCWFIDEHETRLVQVQETHFLHNWRKVSGMEKYPRYVESIRPAFEAEWLKFRSFVESEGMQTPNVVQCEITFINHFERGREWQDHSDLAQIICCWRDGGVREFLPSPTLDRLQLSFPIAEDGGVLMLRMEPGVRNRDAKDILQMTLTARGKSSSSDLGALMQWFDLAHEWVVRGFVDITTEKMHEIWGRKR